MMMVCGVCHDQQIKHAQGQGSHLGPHVAPPSENPSLCLVNQRYERIWTQIKYNCIPEREINREKIRTSLRHQTNLKFIHRQKPQSYQNYINKVIKTTSNPK